MPGWIRSGITAAHRLFTIARWSADAVELVLADLIAARLLPAGSSFTLAVYDTFF